MNTPQRPPLNPTQIKIVKAKAAGKKQRDIGREIFPDATPGSQSTLVSRELKKVDVKLALEEAMISHGITLDAAIAPIATALKGKRTILVDGTPMEIDDVDLQLKGSDRALKLMGIGQQAGNVTVNYIGYAADQREIYDL